MQLCIGFFLLKFFKTYLIDKFHMQSHDLFMVDNEFYVKGANGQNLYGKCWSSNGVKAVIALLHGLSDHINRYGYFAEFLCQHQIAVLGLDYPGHGKSPGKRGHIQGYDLALANVETLLIESRNRYNDLPVFLYGQSLGGNLAMNYALHYFSYEIQGLILSAPWIKLTFTPSWWKVIMTMILGKLIPAITLSMDLDPVDLSHDPEIGRKFLEDPLNHGKISAGIYSQTVKAGLWNLENAGQLNYPVLLMHGKEDPLTSWHATAELADKIGPKAELKLWNRLNHELHNEYIKDEVLAYIINWIEKYI